MHSSTEAADVLVEAGLHRPGLWLAAAAGLLPAVRDRVGIDNSLRADPGPYRPNWADVGRPAGETATAIRELIDAASYTLLRASSYSVT